MKENLYPAVYDILPHRVKAQLLQWVRNEHQVARKQDLYLKWQDMMDAGYINLVLALKSFTITARSPLNSDTIVAEKGTWLAKVRSPLLNPPAMREADLPSNYLLYFDDQAQSAFRNLATYERMPVDSEVVKMMNIGLFTLNLIHRDYIIFSNTSNNSGNVALAAEGMWRASNWNPEMINSLFGFSWWNQLCLLK